MKKNVLKITGLLAIGALSVFNLQMPDSNGESLWSLASLGNVAMARGEEDGPIYEACETWELAHQTSVQRSKECAINDPYPRIVTKYWWDCKDLLNSCCPMPEDEPDC